MDQVKFTAMKDGDAEDYDFLTEHESCPHQRHGGSAVGGAGQP